MMQRWMPFIILALSASFFIRAQGGASYLLSQTNRLRREQGLPAYVIHSALTAAAHQQASWMAATGRISHTQDDGAGPRERARQAGYPTSWVSENIYMGGDPSPQSAWNFWLTSSIHYAGLVSPYYDSIGIGQASGGGRHAFVMVFGNSSGRRPQVDSNQPSRANQPPSYVLGIDAVGNIMHQIQPGHTAGDIALIYGYSWDDIPYMLEINNMTDDDLRQLEVGSVFLVPPQDGTFTPTAAPTAPSATPTALHSTIPAPTVSPSPSSMPVRGLTVRAIPTQTLTPAAQPGAAADGLSPTQLVLTAAVIIQVGIIAAASLALMRQLR